MDKLRSDLKIIRQVQSGEVSYVVKDPVAIKYYRFGALEHGVLARLDGSHDHDDIAREASLEAGITLSASMVASFVESIKKINLIQRTTSEKSLLLLERLRKERKLKAETGTEGRDILYMRFPFFDPDHFYDRLIKRIGFFWGRPFVIGCFVMFALAAIIIAGNWRVIGTGLGQLYSFENKTVADVLMFICVLFTVIVFHENGHGLTCKRYGGEVHELGFMLIYFMPAFYANVTDAWTFQSKAAKLWVTFAGAFVELIICSLAAFVWYFSTPGYFLHDLAFTFMLVAGLSSILINMNPLIKLDGYFALVDYLEIPNLSDDASKYLGALVRRYIFRAPVQVPSYSRRMKRILITYGALASCYRIFILVVVLLFFNRHINRLFPEIGVLLFPLVAYRLLRKKLKSAWKSVRFVLADKKEVLMKPRFLAISGSALAAALGLFLFLPLPYSHRATFVIEPRERTGVRALTGGFVVSVIASEGTSVRRGAVLAVMRDEDLEQRRDSLRSRIAVLDRRGLLERAEGSTADSLKHQSERDQLAAELVDTETRLARLNIKAPADGVVITARLKDRLGAMLKEGDEFCELAAPGQMLARATVDDWNLQDVKLGALTELRLEGEPGAELRGFVFRLAPASTLHQQLSPASEKARERSSGLLVASASVERERNGVNPFEAPLTRFDALIQIDGDTSLAKPGMSGEVKIYGDNRPLAASVWRGVRDWFRSKIWW